MALVSDQGRIDMPWHNHAVRAAAETVAACAP